MSETIPHPGTYNVSLGSTYNLVDCGFSHEPIFDGEIDLSARRMQLNRERWNYRKVESSRDALKSLGINAWLQTRDTSNLGGAGLTTKADFSKRKTGTTVHIVGEYEYIIEAESIDHSFKLKEQWEDLVYEGSTHFVRGITYGAKAIFLLTLTSSEVKSTADVNASLKFPKELAVSMGIDLGASLKVNLNEYDIKIDYWAVPSTAEGLPTTVAEMMSRINGLKGAALAMPGGRGGPLSVELQSLHLLDARFISHRFPTTQTLERILDDREELLSVQSGCASLVAEIQEHRGNVAQEKELADLANNVFELLKKFDERISNLKPDEEDIEGHFAPAVALYMNSNKENSYLRGRYSAELTRIQQHIQSFTQGPRVRVSAWYQNGVLCVHVYECLDLPRWDTGKLGEHSKVDAFVQVQILTEKKVFFSEKSIVKHGNKSNPVFNETFTSEQLYEERAMKATILVRVWDYDKLSKNDLIGEAKIPGRLIGKTRDVGKWYHLQTRGSSHKKCTVM